MDVNCWNTPGKLSQRCGKFGVAANRPRGDPRDPAGRLRRIVIKHDRFAIRSQRNHPRIRVENAELETLESHLSRDVARSGPSVCASVEP